MLLEQLLADRPKLHFGSDGMPTSWAANVETLRYLVETVKPGMKTLETGSGYSTVVFAMAGADHICITPDPREGETITAYCRKIGVEPRIRFVHESSDKALARGDILPDELDLVFIDGAHRFPFPAIDWHYTEGRLKIGGIMGVDDHLMPSVRVLTAFLAGEDEWKLDRSLENTIFFRRVKMARDESDWQRQRMNDQDKWSAPARRSVGRRIWGRLKRILGAESGPTHG